MKAEPRRVMNSRSPRVVSIRSIPVRGVSGNRIAKNVNRASNTAITAKKVTVGQVHAIQDKSIVRFSLSDAAEREALGDVVADEIDDQRPGDDGENTGSRQYAPIKPGG